MTPTEQLREALGIVHNHIDSEITAFPYWAIVYKNGLGRNVWLCGPWFNREDAEKHLENKKHRYPKKSFVYCFSGHDSWHYRSLFEFSKQALALLDTHVLVPREPTEEMCRAGANAILIPKLEGTQGSEMKEALDAYKAMIEAADSKGNNDG